jgi:hypothetical protein
VQKTNILREAAFARAVDSNGEAGYGRSNLLEMCRYLMETWASFIAGMRR